MVSNRRNYYRLLNVQSDAAPSVIKAAYRALMADHHPDTGGDPEVAALLNEAYAVLSNDARRAAYDAARAVRNGAHMPFERGSARRHSGEHGRITSCPMCAFGATGALGVDPRCGRCTAPLKMTRLSSGVESGGERRSVARVAKSAKATLVIDWTVPGIDVQLRDTSTDGLSFYCGGILPKETRVRVVSDAFDMVVEVVSTRPVQNRLVVIHARTITSIFSVKTGGFVSATA